MFAPVYVRIIVHVQLGVVPLPWPQFAPPGWMQSEWWGKENSELRINYRQGRPSFWPFMDKFYWKTMDKLHVHVCVPIPFSLIKMTIAVNAYTHTYMYRSDAEFPQKNLHFVANSPSRHTRSSLPWLSSGCHLPSPSDSSWSQGWSFYGNQGHRGKQIHQGQDHFVFVYEPIILRNIRNFGWLTCTLLYTWSLL